LSRVVVIQHDLGLCAARRGFLHLRRVDPHMPLVKFLKACLVYA
jgi:hypothetical protein